MLGKIVVECLAFYSLGLDVSLATLRSLSVIIDSLTFPPLSDELPVAVAMADARITFMGVSEPESSTLCILCE